MKIATIVIRILIGLFLLFASITYFFNVFEQPPMKGNIDTFMKGLAASTYLMPLAKAVELLTGLSYVSGKYVTLANIIILPVTLNILLINYFMAPENILIAALLFISNLFLIYRYWNNYKTVFTP